MDEIPEGWDQGLYEKLSFEKLIECAEKKKIEEWNALYLKYLESEWIRLYPEREWDPKNVFELVRRDSEFKRPDFSGEKFSGRDFQGEISQGMNFAGIHLEGADFRWTHLERASFREAHLEGAAFRDVHLERASFTEAHLERVYFSDAHLEGVDFRWTHLERVYIGDAHLEEADFMFAHLDGANFMFAHFEGADFRNAHLEKAYFREVHLEKAYFSGAHLEGADIRGAHLEGADLMYAHIEGANFSYAIVDGETLFDTKFIDEKTNFTGTALSATRINPNLRTKLERNIREIQWRNWYCKSKISPLQFMKKLTGKIDETEEEEEECHSSLTDRVFINPFVRVFWCLTDYGSSTKRVIGVFFAWNIFWAFIYQFVLPLQSVPILDGTNTMVLDTPNIITAVMQTNLMMFSITDVATKNLDYPALIFVTVQIVIGYFILAALITRLGIMFQNLSP